jgi:uncharacterized protein
MDVLGKITDRELSGKVADLLERLRALPSVLVAFSGGVDSSLLAVMAQLALGDRALAVTIVSPLLPQLDFETSRQIAEQYGLRHTRIEFDPLQCPELLSNPPNRCYHCKTAIFQALWRKAADCGVKYVLDGENADDAMDYRPGRQAAIEQKIISPLAEAGFSKQDIRAVSNLLAIPIAGRPASACLASRVPYGTPLAIDMLSRIDRAETLLRAMGFAQVRVRAHGEAARIELPAADIQQAARPEVRDAIVRAIQDTGFRYAALDLLGYRMGSLNEEL